MIPILILALCLLGCAVPATRTDITTSWNTHREFDPMWANNIQIFGKLSAPIQTLEKDSGIIVTEWFALHSSDATSVDCGTPSALSITYETQAKITVIIRDIGESKRQITVQGLYRQRRYYDRQTFYATCFSDGTIERMIKDGIVGTP